MMECTDTQHIQNFLSDVPSALSYELMIISSLQGKQMVNITIKNRNKLLAGTQGSWSMYMAYVIQEWDTHHARKLFKCRDTGLLQLEKEKCEDTHSENRMLIVLGKINWDHFHFE